MAASNLSLSNQTGVEGENFKEWTSENEFIHYSRFEFFRKHLRMETTTSFKINIYSISSKLHPRSYTISYSR